MHSKHLDLPEAHSAPQSMPAACFYVDFLRNATEKVTLIPVGPLTNLGLALRIAPDIVDKIEEIVIMGGGSKITNCNPWSESNIWHDPEAAQIVATCGARVVWVPLDATHRACITLDDCKRFREIGTFSANFAAEQCEQRIIVHNAQQPLDIPDAAAVHDALCVGLCHRCLCADRPSALSRRDRACRLWRGTDHRRSTRVSVGRKMDTLPTMPIGTNSLIYFATASHERRSRDPMENAARASDAAFFQIRRKALRKIIMDVDTGTDDAIAIMAAALAPELELVALCSVHGNTSVENTTRNTLRAAFAAGQ